MGIGFKLYKKILDRIYKGGSINNKFVSKIGRKIHSSIKPTYIEKFGFK